VNRSSDQDFGETEALLRRRLNELADHAPVTVRQPDELTVSWSTADSPNRRRRAAGIGATIAVIAGGVGISTLAFQGASNPGGADSPEEAVQAFTEALEREDVLGMIDVALPEEVSALRSVFEDATNEVERVGILDESFSLAGVQGVDVAVPGLTLTTENLDTDLAVVTATGGTLDAAFDPASFPLGAIVREVLGDELSASTTSQPLSGTDPPVMLATVARDGRWYVSLGFTVAEYARLAAGAEFPSPVAIERVGSESPEAATLAFYERLAALDLEGAIAMMAPGEGDALLRYSPLFVPDAQAAIERARAEGLTVSISGLDLQTAGDGDRRTLTPESFVVEGTVPSTWGFVTYADPTIPTVVYSMDGRYAVVPAGEQVPATIDELELVTDHPGPSITNQTYELPDGTIQPIEFPTSAPEGPQSFRVERRDGCTDLTGPGIDKLLPGLGNWAARASSNYSVVDGAHRVCDGPTPVIGAMFSLFFVGGFPTELPSISVVESDGQWYVSPIGTLGASVVDQFRSVPDDANLIDTPLAGFLFLGMSREAMNSTLAAASTIPTECEAVAAVGADGVPAVIPDPPVSEIRACAERLFNVTFESDSGSGSFVPAPTETVVPASTPEDQPGG
jgi:hypothetical protein